MADGQKSYSKSPGLSSKFQRMYKAVSPNNPPWKEAYRKVLFIIVLQITMFSFVSCSCSFFQ